MCDDIIQTRIRAIGEDRVRGATDLALDACSVLVDLAASNPGLDALAHAADLLERAQPAIAPVRRVAELARGASSPQALLLSCSAFQRLARSAGAAIAGHAVRLIPRCALVLTHSASRAVRETLLALQPPAVLCTVSEPMREGVTLARELTAAGLAVTVVADDEAAATVIRVDVVLVGADAVTPAWIRNKRGTRAMAEAARQAAKPFYVLCDSTKFWDGPLAGSALFDDTPWDLVTSVISEIGPLAPPFPGNLIDAVPRGGVE